MLTQSRLKELLNYNPDTGVFTYRVQKGSKLPGEVAGWENTDKYIRIDVDNKRYSAHRLAWLYMTGKHPEIILDHINGIRGDNRWCNLRECNYNENAFHSKMKSNNKLGIKGVTKEKYGYRARVMYMKKHISLGSYKTKEEAAAAYNKFAKENFGEFYINR